MAGNGSIQDVAARVAQAMQAKLGELTYQNTLLGAQNAALSAEVRVLRGRLPQTPAEQPTAIQPGAVSVTRTSGD